MQKFLSRLNSFPKYLLAAVLIIVPLFPKFPFIQIPGISVSVRLEDFLILALAVVTSIKIIPNLRNFLKDKIVMAFVIFFSIGAVSVIAGIFLTQTVVLSTGILHFLRRIEYSVPLFAVLALLKKDEAKNNLDFYIKVLMLDVLVAFLYGFGQRYLYLPVIVTQNEEYSKGIALRWTPGAHINSTFAGHYDLASFIVLVLPFFTTLFFLTKELKLKVWLFITSLSGLWLLGASLSRISLVSWVIASSLPLILFRKYKAVAAILMAAVLIVIAFPSFLGRYEELLKVVDSGSAKVEVLAADFLPARQTPEPPVQTPVPVVEDRSTSIRLNVEWPRAVSAFYKNPLLGTGYSSIGLATDNDFLRALGEAGVLGLTAFVLIFLRIGRIFLRYLKNIERFSTIENAFLSGLLASTVGILLTAVFLDIFEASKFALIYWFLIAYAITLIRNRLNEQ